MLKVINYISRVYLGFTHPQITQTVLSCSKLHIALNFSKKLNYNSLISFNLRNQQHRVGTIRFKFWFNSELRETSKKWHKNIHWIICTSVRKLKFWNKHQNSEESRFINSFINLQILNTFIISKSISMILVFRTYRIYNIKGTGILILKLSFAGALFEKGSYLR